MANQETYELNNPQRLFLRYTIAVLVALTVLNLFEEYWDLVDIGSFSISLATGSGLLMRPPTTDRSSRSCAGP